MMLLTSSQVSIALSSAIVISCTTALFLSGYVIQQRTVGHLRAAIRPNPSPQIHIPDRFREDTTELADGTIVVLDVYNRPVRQQIAVPGKPEGRKHVVDDGEVGEVAVEVHETPVATPDEQQQQRLLAIEKLRQETEDAEARGLKQEAEQASVQTQPQPAPWETRAEEEQISEEGTELAEDETQKPVSRAERRRLIKEEIMRLAQGDEPVYYQRRLY